MAENSSLLFTPIAVLDLLSQIDELSDLDISLMDDESSVSFQIGDSTYTIKDSEATDVPADEETIEQVEDLNNESELVSDAEVEEIDDIQSGIIKSLLKTLAVGGLVRLTNKILRSGK